MLIIFYACITTPHEIYLIATSRHVTQKGIACLYVGSTSHRVCKHLPLMAVSCSRSEREVNCHVRAKNVRFSTGWLAFFVGTCGDVQAAELGQGGLLAGTAFAGDE